MHKQRLFFNLHEKFLELNIKNEIIFLSEWYCNGNDYGNGIRNTTLYCSYEKNAPSHGTVHKLLEKIFIS